MELIEIYCTLLSFPSNSMTYLRPFCRAGRRSKSFECAKADLNQYIHFERQGRDYLCSLCSTFQSKRPSKVRDHLEAIHFPGLFVYSCQPCGKTFTGKNAFAVHNSVKHPKYTRSSNVKLKKPYFSFHNVGPLSQLPLCKTQRTYTSL